MGINSIEFQPGYLNVAKLLMDNHANISAENNDKDAALHLSAINGIIKSSFFRAFFFFSFLIPI